jgi:hypothetical protein
MQYYYEKEKRTLTPLKAQQILAKHGTPISLENAALMLDFLYKLSNLSVSEALRRAKKTPPAAPPINRNCKLKNKNHESC